MATPSLRRVGRAVVTALVMAGLCPPVIHAEPVSTRAVADPGVKARASRADYLIGPGDTVRVTVFGNPDLSIEARIDEGGSLSYPLVGAIDLAGLTTRQAETRIAELLAKGGFVNSPSVTMQVSQFRSQQVSVLGQVSRPGRYPIDTTTMRLSEVLAIAGGIAPAGGDVVVLATEREGKPQRIQVDLVSMFLAGNPAQDLPVRGGDVVYVHRAPVFYIYGHVQRPGMYTIERDMTLAQAIAKGGGLTLRGTERSVRIKRREAGQLRDIDDVRLEMPVRGDDLIYVRESVF